MSASEIFTTKIASRLADPAQASTMKELDAVYQFNLTGAETGSWFVDLKAGQVGTGTHDAADCTITVDASDFEDLYNGDVQGAQLFMTGKLKIAGNIGLALKLNQIMG
jgi:putative sterol carrier protein